MSNAGLPSETFSALKAPAIDTDYTRRWLDETHHQIYKGALATTGFPDETKSGSFRDHKIDVVDYPMQMRPITKTDLLQCNVVLEGKRLNAFARQMLRGNLQIQKLDHIKKYIPIAAHLDHGGIGLLQQRDQPLRTKRQRSHYG